jgi:predicted nucleotidyltransferase
MNPKMKAIVTEFLEYLERLYADRLAQMVVFGSQARGDAAEGSNIDILIVLQG